MIPSEVDSWIDNQNDATRGRGWALRRIPLPNLRLRVSERRLMLVLLDLALVNGALVLAFYLRGPDGAPPSWAFPKWHITLSIIWIGCAVFFDVYHLANAARPFTAVQRILGAALVATLIYTFTPYLTPPLAARSQTFLFVGISCVGLAGWRFFYARVFVQPWFDQQALVVGAGAAAHELASALSLWARTSDGRHTSYSLVGYIDANPDLWDTSIQSVPVWGGHDLLLPLVKRMDIDEIVLAITHRHVIAGDLMDALLQCSEYGVRVTTMGMVYERLFGRVPVDHLGSDLPRLLDMEEGVGDRVYAGVRRIADILFALTGLGMLALVSPVILAANRVTSSGPLFYRQNRVGRGGRCFSVVKFRTMTPDAEELTGPVWAEEHDLRVTPMGRWLRRTRLDELPQFINVLRGEMSLIGPRPERPEFVEDLATELPFYRIRHAVRPGLTGWAQVKYRYANSLADTREKLEYDLYYVKHQGPLIDLQILVKTVAVVLQFRGT